MSEKMAATSAANDQPEIFARCLPAFRLSVLTDDKLTGAISRRQIHTTKHSPSMATVPKYSHTASDRIHSALPASVTHIQPSSVDIVYI